MVETKTNMLQTELCGITLDNPVMAASGTFGYGREFAELYDINCLGSFSFKGTTLEPRFGNPTPRIAECEAGLINSIGLQNPGVEKVIEEELPHLATIFDKKVMANIGGFSVEEYAQVAQRLDRCDQIGWIEVNISCPNVKEGGVQFGTSCIGVEQITAAVRKHCTKPLMVKLSPNVTDIGDIAASAEAGGADAISMINTLTGMRIDIQTRRPIIRNNTGGVSGPALLPIAVRMIWQAYNRVKIPIVGMGGVSNWKDAVELMLAGSTALQIGTAFFTNPYAPVEIIEGLNKYLDENGISSVTELTGKMIPWGE